MTDFPVSSSILSTGPLAKFLRNQYSFSEDTRCSLLKAGISHSYLVTTNEKKYIFRIYSLNWRTKTEILEEIKLLESLNRNAIPVSIGISNKEGVFLQELNAPEGIRYGVLFSYAPGEKQLNSPAAVHYQVGQQMARMHLITAKLHLNRVTYTTSILLDEPFERIKTFLTNTTDEMKFMTAARKYLLQQYQSVDIKSVRTGVVHMDIWFDNLHFDRNGIVTFFDFDFCGNGWLLHDIAYYLLQLKSTEKEESEFKLKSEQFLSGYESVTVISDEERRMLPAAATSMYFFYLGVQIERYENWSNTFFNEVYLKRFIKVLVKGWVEYWGIDI